ncbi:unnamed protein product [Brachionus calyciflorus]|uniref:Uncharacterized protein n=1 Tax=Brachionus calyciflorus TaxID=104777 RepID=A0A813TEJ9_9BILA|nr:unnamed protein product [Brachionus calyciflorus]
MKFQIVLLALGLAVSVVSGQYGGGAYTPRQYKSGMINQYGSGGSYPTPRRKARKQRYPAGKPKQEYPNDNYDNDDVYDNNDKDDYLPDNLYKPVKQPKRKNVNQARKITYNNYDVSDLYNNDNQGNYARAPAKKRRQRKPVNRPVYKENVYEDDDETYDKYGNDNNYVDDSYASPRKYRNKVYEEEEEDTYEQQGY